MIKKIMAWIKSLFKTKTPHPQNPRQMTEAQVKHLTESLNKFNIVEIPAINTDNTILAGHQRLKILQMLGRGQEEVDVRVPNRQLDEAEAKEYVVRSNLNTGMWDFEVMANHFSTEDLLGWGFDKQELQKGFDLTVAPTPEDNDIPEKAAPVAKLGELWGMGAHRMLVGDATMPVNYVTLMDGKTAQMTFTDPPYNVAYEGGGNYAEHGTPKREAIKNDNLSKTDFAEFLLEVVENILKWTDGGIYVCMSSSEIDSLKSVFEKAGGHFQSFIIWVKNTFTLSRSDYQSQYEPMLYGWRGDVTNHYFIGKRDMGNVWEDMRDLKTHFDGEHTIVEFAGYKVKLKGKVEGEVIRKKQTTDIWKYNKPAKSELHPTMKPVELVTEAIKNSSVTGRIVLDPFLDSGTTIIAAEKLGRACYGMELDEHYASIILQRYFEFTGQDPVRLSDGKRWTELTNQNDTSTPGKDS